MIELSCENISVLRMFVVWVRLFGQGKLDEMYVFIVFFRFVPVHTVPGTSSRVGVCRFPVPVSVS